MGAEATLKMLLLGEDRSAGKALKGVGDQAEKTHSRLSKVASVAGAALAGGLVVAGAAAMKFAKNAADDEQAARRLAIALHNSAGATKAQVAQTEDWISAQGKAYGVSDDELRPALNKLVTATHDVGKAQKLSSLAMDISAGTGKSLEVVSMALAKAQNGNVASLGRLGLKVKDADGKTKSLHQVTKDLAETYKGQASAAAESTAGKQKRLTVALDEAGESIGYRLIPVMLKMTEVATAALGWMQKHPKLMKDGAIAVGLLAAAIVVLRVGMLGAAAVSKVMAVSQAMQAVAAGTATEAQIALNAAMRANMIGLIVTALVLLVGGLIMAYKHSETFRNIVNGAFSAVGSAIRGIWNSVLAPVFEFWGKALGSIMFVWSKLLQAIGNVPGFGWVGKLGDKLAAAADIALHLNLRLNDVAKDRTANIHIKYTTSQMMGAPSITKPRVPHSAVGARFTSAGPMWVGERGPEIAWLPRGTGISTAADSAAMMSGGSGGDLGTLTIVVQSDTGEVIEQKLAKVKRTRGGATLAFA